MDANGEKQEGAVIVDISGEMKLTAFSINDTTLLDPNKKDELEQTVIKCFQKAQNKAQEVVAEKTKDELGFDPSNLGSMMG
ncbi:MAG: YbaB/EbfC family nucleoid-associated protein [bacterium]|nr:YbaB/EbfC family nucleoid-associated protein [bacterium]